MDLDRVEDFARSDSHNILAALEVAPRTLAAGWEAGATQPLPALTDFRRIAVTARGDAAQAAEIALACAGAVSPFELHLLADEFVPAWLEGADTLLIRIPDGAGRLPETPPGLDARTPLDLAPSGDEPAALYRTAGSLLALLYRLGVAPGMDAYLPGAVEALETQAASLHAGVEICRNPAKRLAGQFMERCVVLTAAEHLIPAARRWKTQINRCGRALAALEILPACENPLGTCQPEAMLDHLMAIFLIAPGYHAANRTRIEASRMASMVDGINTDVYTPSGGSRLAESLCTVQFGDFCAAYLAMLYGYDPGKTVV